MRKNVVKAYEFFVANIGVPVTPTELKEGAGLGTGGSGPGPIVYNLKSFGLPIETIKNGKNVASSVLPKPVEGDFVPPAAFVVIVRVFPCWIAYSGVIFVCITSLASAA